MPDVPTDRIIEGEVVPEVSPAVSQTLDLTGLINNYLDQIEVSRKQISQIKDMVDAAYANDPTYQQHDAAVKEATKIRTQTKKQIQKQPQVADLVAQLTDHKATLKELQTQLSQYLQDYAKVTGSDQFEDSAGQVLQIVYQARLVKKS